MNVVVEGLMVNYQKAGRGKEKVVCLPGWGDDLSSFAGLTDSLKDKFTVISLDLPGFGGTQTPASAWGLDNYANFVAQWLKKLKINQPYAIVGHSFGGSVAIDSLSSGKIKSKKLILLASAGIRNKQPARKKMLKAAAKTGKASLYFLPATSRRKLRGRFYRAIGSDSHLVPHMEDTFRQIITQDISAKAARLKLPALLVYGSRDKSTPIEDGWVLSQLIEGSKLEIIEAGHFLHQTNTQEVAGLITNFLKAKS